MIICIDTYGVDISKDNNCFKISDTANNITKLVSVLKVTALQLYKPCTISTPAMLLAVAHNIPVVIHDGTATPLVKIVSALAGNHGLIRKHQVLFGLQKAGLQWISSNIGLKMEGQLANAKYCCNRKSNLPGMEKWVVKMEVLITKFNTEQPSNLPGVTVVEAQVSRCYWQLVKLTLNNSMLFTAREKQLATMPFNAALHYGYGMLYNVVDTAVHTAGLDPQISILHTDKYAARSFVFDAIEPFRPWIDRLVIDLFLNGTLNQSHFEPYAQGGMSVNKPGKAIIIPAVIAWMGEKNLFLNRKVKRKDQVQFYLTQLAQYLLKEFKPQYV
jgi:CRISPR-associated protein Cas1